MIRVFFLRILNPIYQRRLDYKLVEHESYDYLSELLIDKSISSIIEIPDGFYDMFASGQDGNITITSTDDFENAAFLEAYMNSYLAGVKLLSINAKGDQRAFDRLITEYKEVKSPYLSLRHLIWT